MNRNIETVRAGWKNRLPGWMQPFLTWVIGFPYEGQQPSLGKKPWYLPMMVAMAFLLAGMGLAQVIVSRGGMTWLAMPVAWMMVVSGARTLQVQIGHQGVHNQLSGNGLADRIVVELASTLAGAQDFDGYKADHVGIHHPKLATSVDPDRIFTMEVMNIRPGIAKATNKRRFVRSLFSPRIHAIFVIGRLRANLLTSPPYRRIMAAIWFAIIAASIYASENRVGMMVGWLCPLVILYQVSAMCQFVTEHFWTRQRKPGESRKFHNGSLLLNRHLGDPLPAIVVKGLTWLLAWARWWFRLAFYHGPVRMTVLLGDLPVHGTHHIWPLCHDWPNAIYSYHELSERSGRGPIEVVGSFGSILDVVMASFEESEFTSSNVKMTLRGACEITNGM